MIVYGIKNCTTVKKACAWLDEHGMEYRFHDLRKDGLDAEQIQRWVTAFGWATLLNTRGTTWRQLPDARRVGLNEARARQIMLDYPAVIKRPIIERGIEPGDQRLLGFGAESYSRLLG